MLGRMAFDVAYGITRRFSGTTLAEVRPRVQSALAAEGFGVLTEIDMQRTLQQKLGVERPPYVILGACNPKLANRALQAEPAIGLMLPCNVVLAEDGEEVVVSAASPRGMFSVVEKPSAELTAVAAEAEERLKRALDSL